MRSSALACVVALVGGCIALPPSRTELSTVARPSATGYRFATGGHTASVPRRIELPLDLGAGYVYEVVGDGEAQHGNSLELGRQVWRRARTRAFAAARAEVFWNDAGPESTTRAATVRLAVERVLGHVAGGVGGGGSAAAAYGIFAPGLYLEAGTRARVDGRTSAVVTAGIYLRLPFVIAASRPTVF